MKGWLQDWKQSVPSSHSSMEHGTGMNMMSTADMTKLRGATGGDFESIFLTMMIQHHEGAITMAKDELRNGKDASAKPLAQAIVDPQEAEIAEMQRLLSG